MFDPLGETNALHCDLRIPRSRATPIKLPRIHGVIYTILDGPQRIIVHRTDKDYKKLCAFELVLKIMRGPIMPLREVWALYETGYRIPGVVLRYARVEKQALERARATNSLPTIVQHTRYLPRMKVRTLLRDCKALDRILLAGNLLQPATEKSIPWHISTLYKYVSDLGSIELNWNGTAQAHLLEAHMQRIASRISDILSRHAQEQPEKIEHMEFVYENPDPDAIDLIDSVNPQSEIPNPQ